MRSVSSDDTSSGSSVYRCTTFDGIEASVQRKLSVSPLSLWRVHHDRRHSLGRVRKTDATSTKSIAHAIAAAAAAAATVGIRRVVTCVRACVCVCMSEKKPHPDAAEECGWFAGARVCRANECSLT